MEQWSECFEETPGEQATSGFTVLFPRNQYSLEHVTKISVAGFGLVCFILLAYCWCSCRQESIPDPSCTEPGKYVWAPYCLTQRQEMILVSVLTGGKSNYWLCNWHPLLLSPQKSLMKSTLLTKAFQNASIGSCKETWFSVSKFIQLPETTFWTLAFVGW